MNAITISYDEAVQAPVSVALFYEIEQVEDVQTITCIVKAGEALPAWLQLRKFQVAARKVRGGFMTLYDERNEDKNLDCTLFIDQAYAAIMKKEKKRVCLQD
jgi:hypothetical protein